MSSTAVAAAATHDGADEKWGSDDHFFISEDVAALDGRDGVVCRFPYHSLIPFPPLVKRE